MLKCLCCGRRGSQGSGEDGEGGAPPDDQEESPCEADQDAVDAAVVEDAAPVTTPPPPTTTTTTTSPPAPAKMRNLNALGLRVDASVDAELAELGMDASVLLEPLTPRSLMTSTPYPGKRASVVLDAVRGGALDGLLPDSPDDEEELPPDALPALAPREQDGTREPPATPVGRDELALRRHRFFSDLLTAAQAAADHRVRFDPRGPVVAGEPPGQPPLDEVLGRLENVTCRLERSIRSIEAAILLTPDTAAAASAAVTPSDTPPAAHRAPPRTPPGPTPSSPSSACSPSSPSASAARRAPNGRTVTFDLQSGTMSLQAYQDILAGPFAQYFALSSQIGGDVAEQAANVKNVFDVQLQFLQAAGSRPKPSNQSDLMALLQPTSRLIMAIQEHREKKRASPQFNHLSTVSESIPALGWVAVSPAPSPFVKEMKDAGMFYGNRVLKDFKDRDRTHVDWVNSWIQTLVELQDFVKKHHTTGLEWQPVRAGGAPPPPPAAMPPPPPVLPEGDLNNLALDPTKDRSALFAEINQGENITRSLKKVTSDMQTHKNPNLRSGSAPIKTADGKPATGGAGFGAPVDKPPKFSRDGKKWIIEYQKGNKNLVVDGAEMNNVVYMFKCVDSTLIVKGKINSIVMDSCKKSAVVFDSLVSSVEFVNCQSVQMQVNGIVPTITIDKTDGCQMYLSPDSLNVEIVSSKSSEMNVLIPSASGDYVEHAIPEQYRTKVNKSGLTTTVVESLG